MARLVVVRPDSVRPAWPAWSIAVALACLLAGLYLANGSPLPGNDTKPARYAAVSLVKRGDLDLDEYAARFRLPDGSLPYYVIAGQAGHVLSRFGPGVPVVAAPAFALALALDHGRISEPSARVVGKIVGAAAVAAAAGLLFLLALRLGAGRWQALVVALLYGVASGAFSISSQALWQHGPAELFLVLGLWLLAIDRPSAVVASGASLAAMVVCRPADFPLALGALGYVLVARRRQLVPFVLGALPFVLAQAAYDSHYLGAPWRIAQAIPAVGGDAPQRGLFSAPPLQGLAGLLISPSRGLFVYSPYLLFLLWRPRESWRRHAPLVRALLLGAAGLLLLMSSWYSWYGGWTFGCRMLVDSSPILCLALIPALDRLAAERRRVVVALFGAACLAAVGVHALGAYCYDPYGWDAQPDVDRHPERLWSIRDGQLAYWLAHRSLRRLY